MIEFSGFMLFLLIFSYLGIAILFNCITNSELNYKNKFINMGIYLSILLIISQTIFPIQFGYEFKGFEIYNLIPFKVIYEIYRDYSFLYFSYQILGNIIMFVPFGYFVFLKTNNSICTIVIAFLATLSVEIIQGFIPYRFCEIDDLLLNTLGTYVGIVVCRIFNTKYTEKEVI